MSRYTHMYFSLHADTPFFAIFCSTLTSTTLWQRKLNSDFFKRVMQRSYATQICLVMVLHCGFEPGPVGVYTLLRSQTWDNQLFMKWLSAVCVWPAWCFTGDSSRPPNPYQQWAAGRPRFSLACHYSLSEAWSVAEAVQENTGHCR